MSPQPVAPQRERQPGSKILVDESAEGAPVMSGGERLEDFIDDGSLKMETEKAHKRNLAVTRGFRQYQKKVIDEADVPNTHQTRQMASNICGAVARLPFVPDDEIKIKDGEDETTEFEQQVVKTAALAEEMLGSEMVWTTSAQKLARAALKLRAKDPDGSKGIAWVNDTLEDEAHVLDA